MVKRKKGHKLIYAIKSMDFTSGGAEKVLAEVTSGMVQKGYNVSVLTFDTPGGTSFYKLHEDVKRISLGIGNPQNKSKFFETIKRMKRLRETMKKERPDTVIAFMHSMFVPMSFALIGTGIPVIASEHTVSQHYKSRPLEYILMVISSLFVKRITVLSDAMAETFPSYLRPRMYTLPNPVNIASEQEYLKAGKEINEPKIILNVGRLEEEKDQKTLIQAFAALADDYPDWQLRIIGEGKLRKELESIVKALKLETRVFLPGKTNQIETEYKNADLFVLPSLYESFGLATIEAMSKGVPAIGFEGCLGAKEMISHDNNGLLIPSDNRIVSLAQAMKTLMDDPQKRKTLGEKAKDTALNFHSDKVNRNWEKLIRYVNIKRTNLNTFLPKRLWSKMKPSSSK